MGGALLRGWLQSDCVMQVSVLEPNPLPFADPRITPLHSTNDIQPVDIIVLAIKPQMMRDICAMIKPHVAHDCPVLSIAAGQTLASIKTYFHEEQPIIRAMPNLPAAVGAGITALCANENGKQYRALSETLLNAVGTSVWLDDEGLMDAVTAISGSGPAYVFYLIEALSDAAIKLGLPAAIAMQLARQTVTGSAALAAQDNTPAATLRDNVTSKGGTTEAALSVLMDGRWQEILNEATAKAAARSKELSE